MVSNANGSQEIRNKKIITGGPIGHTGRKEKIIMNYIVITENEIQLHLKKYFHRLTAQEITELIKTLSRAYCDLSQLQKKEETHGKRNVKSNYP